MVIYDNPVKDSYEIHTEYEPLATKDDMTLLKVRLITGKTHQIRAHLAGISHPVLGDFKYGDKVFNEKYGEKNSFFIHIRWYFRNWMIFRTYRKKVLIRHIP